jgi:hypothetical protein
MTERVINIAFRIVFHSILNIFEQKISNKAVTYRWIQKNNLFQNRNKKICEAI